MKKFYLLSVFVSVVLFYSPNPVLADNFAAGDLTYVCLGGNDYLFTVIFYRDCIGNFPSNNIDVNFTSACDTFTSTFPQLGSPVNLVNLCCFGKPTCCDSNVPGCIHGLQKYVFQKQVTLSPCSDWHISWSGVGRSPNDNLDNPGAQNFFIDARLDNLNGFCNSSPQFTNDPAGFMSSQSGYSCYYHGANDPDGDSLVYSLVAPQVAAGIPVTYLPGFSVTHPMPSFPPISIDSITGNICTYTLMPFIASLAVRIEEWRHINGIPAMIGYTIRDMQLNSHSYCSDSLPTLAGINLNATTYNPNDTMYVLDLYLGDTIDFNVYAHDPDIPAQNLTMTYSGGASTGTWSVTGNGTPNPVGHFHWESSANSSGFPFCIHLNIKDDACPTPEDQDFLFCILDTTTASIKNYEKKNAIFDIYPNPAKEIINIIFDNKTDDYPLVELYIVDGKLLQYFPIKEKNTEVNISALPKGTYFIKLTNSNGTSFRKLIKE